MKAFSKCVNAAHMLSIVTIVDISIYGYWSQTRKDSAEREEQEQTKGSSAEVDNYGNISNLKDIFY